jgi:uncharacterized Zn finger protein (UPF0148 family)
MYSERKSLPDRGSLTCPECGGNHFSVNYTKVVCKNCDYTISKGSSNKYGAKKQMANDGIKRDSKYEAAVADELWLRKKAKDIKDYDSQYKIEMWAYDKNGKPAMKKTHKVDFRIHHNDGSFELLEAKGAETQDYKDRRRWLETFWLPENKDHTYTVVKQNSRWK